MLLLLRGVVVEVTLLGNLGGVGSAVGHVETVASLLVWNPWFVLAGTRRPTPLRT